MKLEFLFRFYLLLGCGLFISCLYVQRNFERLDNSSQKVLEKIKNPKELRNSLEENKRYTDVHGRSFKIFRNLHSDEELPTNYKTSARPNKISEMKTLSEVDHVPHSFSENKNENFTPETVLGLEGKEYKNIKSYKHFKSPAASRIRRELAQNIGYEGSTETKKQISSADKFLILEEKERKRLLEKVFNEIITKLNKHEVGNGCIENHGSVEVKPQLLILNSKSKPKREKNSEAEHSVFEEVGNPYSSKSSFNDATKAVSSPDLTTNRDISLIGKQTGRDNVSTEQFTKNSKNFSKREDTQYQTDGIHLTTFMPEARDQKSSMKEPMEMTRVNDNKSQINNKNEITTDQSSHNIHSKEISSSPSGKSVKKRNGNGNQTGQPQLHQILKKPSEANNKIGQNEGSSDSSKMNENINKNYGEDDDLLEYVKNGVKNCLQEMRKDVKEEKEKPETRETNPEEGKLDTASGTKETYPKEKSPEMIKQLSLFDKLNSLNPNSPGFQLLWNILQSTPPKPNILLGENQKAHADYAGPYKPPLVAEEIYLDEVSSEENGKESYDMILQTDLKNLKDFARTFTKPNMEATRFDRFWETDLLELFL